MSPADNCRREFKNAVARRRLEATIVRSSEARSDALQKLAVPDDSTKLKGTSERRGSE